MNFKLVYFIIFSFLLISCGGSKIVNESNKVNSNLSSKNIIKTHQAASPNFSTLAARMQVTYENGDKLQSIAVSLRMEKDNKIWIKASLLGITLAKVLITPDNVSYYESISNTYFDGDFSLLSEWLGTDIDFQKAQAILLGQSIFDLDAKYQSTVIVNKYKLQPKTQRNNFIYSLLFNPDNFKISSENLSQPNDERMFTVNYGKYQKIEEDYYPSQIRIIASQKESKTKITVNYKKIDHNAPIRFPFTIPKGYEEIQLK